MTVRIKFQHWFAVVFLIVRVSIISEICYMKYCKFIELRKHLWMWKFQFLLVIQNYIKISLILT